MNISVYRLVMLDLLNLVKVGVIQNCYLSRTDLLAKYQKA